MIAALKGVGRWLARQGKVILTVLAAVAAVLVVATAVRAIRAKVSRRRGFKVVIGDPTSIDIDDHGESVRVKLPRGVTSDEVTAAGISEIGEWAVEVTHAKTDRHGDPGADDGASLRI